jgi:hypothetical protein
VTRIGKKLRRFIWILFFCRLALASDPVQVVVKATPNPVVIGQPFVLTLQVLSSESVTVEDPELPSLSSFDLVGSWTSQSTSSPLFKGPGVWSFKPAVLRIIIIN